MGKTRRTLENDVIICNFLMLYLGWIDKAVSINDN